MKGVIKLSKNDVTKRNKLYKKKERCMNLKERKKERKKEGKKERKHNILQRKKETKKKIFLKLCKKPRERLNESKK